MPFSQAFVVFSIKFKLKLLIEKNPAPESSNQQNKSQTIMKQKQYFIKKKYNAKRKPDEHFKLNVHRYAIRILFKYSNLEKVKVFLEYTFDFLSY